MLGEVLGLVGCLFFLGMNALLFGRGFREFLERKL